MKRPKQSSVFICGIVRNAADGLRQNIPVINRLCESFKSAHVYVYENDSTDETKQLLIEWQRSHPHVVNISLNDKVPFPNLPEIPKGVNPFFSRRRIEKMVRLRNKYLDYLEEIGWEGDYLIVVDLDVARLDVNAILDSFNTSERWDAISAYGYSLSPSLKKRYHDTYAFWSIERGYDDVQTESSIYNCQKEFRKGPNTRSLMQVASAFGGLTIYVWNGIRGLRYEVEENQDTRVEVCCEHRLIYRQMYERGYNRFFINRNMQLKYQSLSILIVRQWIMRQLNKFVKSINN